MSSSNYFLHRLLAVFLLFCLSKASGGTCLSYGHSCWGGHGKRSSAAHIEPSSQKHTTEWFISRLFDSPAAKPKNIETVFKSQNLDAQEVDNFRPGGYQSYFDAEKTTRREQGNSENELINKKWDFEGNELDEEIMVLTPEVHRVPISKLRLLQITNQEDGQTRNEY